MEKTYTSTGLKLLRHPDVIKKFKETGIATPISLQIAPTSRCNLKCVFCSNVNRDQNEDLNISHIFSLVSALLRKGLKTIEWSGGGDPTLYPWINDVIEWVAGWGCIKQGLITNGVALDHITQENLDRLTWLRISMNCLDYMSGINIPEIKGTLGFSYVINEKTNNLFLQSLYNHVKKYNPEYVRIVPNCQSTAEEQERNNEEYGRMIERWGSPYFYQAKHFSKPERCWWGYFKPFILHDSWVYRCSSVVLNDDAERQFHEKYRWVRMEDLPALYEAPAVPAKTECSHCVFRPQNDLIDMLNVENEMEDFI